MRAASLALRVVAHPLAPLASARRAVRASTPRAFASRSRRGGAHPSFARGRVRDPRRSPPRARPPARDGRPRRRTDRRGARDARRRRAHRPRGRGRGRDGLRPRRGDRGGEAADHRLPRARRPRRARRARAPRAIGGGERTDWLPTEMPDDASGAAAAAARGRGKSAMTSPPDAVDLTGDDDGRRRAAAVNDLPAPPSANAARCCRPTAKGKEPAREDDPSAKTVSGNALMAQLAAAAVARDPSREMARRGARGLRSRCAGSSRARGAQARGPRRSQTAGRSRARPERAAAMVGGGPGASSRSTPGGGILAALASIPDGTRPDPRAPLPEIAR